jgi:pSer/pThr/pTyr-binding forkhead associated (FHA) protein
MSSGGNFDRSRLLRLVLAGAIAGLIIFAVFNPGLVRQESRLPRIGIETMMDLDQAMNMLNEVKKLVQTPDPFGAFMFTGCFAAMLGGLLVIMDETNSPPRRVIGKALTAALYGVLVGGITGILIDQLATRLCRISFFFIAIIQPVGWLLIGLGAGAAIGLTLGSTRRLRACMIGGLVGGFIGGAAFDFIGTATSTFTSSGTLGRLVGFPIMGMLIGASLARIEDFAKQSWVTILSGSKEGRSFILSKSTTTIGRDELADIPLFGDSSVAKQHASLLMQGYVVTLQGTGGEVAVNGVQTQSAQLQPYDVLTIGGHSLRFHQKGQRQPIPSGYYPQYSAPQVPPPQGFAPPVQTAAMPALLPATGNLSLVAISGPHTGLRFVFGPGTVRIGRELGCGVMLALDTVVSRNHAELTWNGTAWVARDLGSRHGLWINGVRVTDHVLCVGDQLGVGQSWLRVETV